MNFSEGELHAMVDLETLGRKPGCKVLSIGAVTFGLGEFPREQFYVPITRASQEMYGLTEEAETLAWWERQSDEAKVSAFNDPAAKSVEAALAEFAAWLKLAAALRGAGAKTTYVWGNGAGFDNPILREVYEKCGVAVPWLWYNDRCYRTLKAQAPHIKIGEDARRCFHHALDDAQVQADHAVEILKWLKK